MIKNASIPRLIEGISLLILMASASLQIMHLLDCISVLQPHLSRNAVAANRVPCHFNSHDRVANDRIFN
jgi:hypothetical protein